MQVLYGMDYLRSEREQQHALLRAALMEHISAHPEALIVIEEYDKLDCATRGFFRQLLENARTANVTLDRYRPLCQLTAMPSVQWPHALQCLTLKGLVEPHQTPSSNIAAPSPSPWQMQSYFVWVHFQGVQGGLRCCSSSVPPLILKPWGV